MSIKENNFDLREVTKKIEEGIKEFEKFDGMIQFLDKNIDLLDKTITPLYETAKKVESFLNKFNFAVLILHQTKQIIPFFEKMVNKKIESSDFTI